MVVVDTFAWIEYFAGSNQGEMARPYIEGGEAVTPSIVIAEFVDKYTRQGLDPTDRLVFIRSKSAIVPLDEDVATLAGRISAERRARIKGWGLVDSIVLATARHNNLKILTGDEHFRDLSEAVMTKRETKER